MESAEIPVIDSHYVYVFIEAVQFPFMMDFHQHFQVKFVGRVCQGTAFGRVSAAAMSRMASACTAFA